jgi:hypothetical protein
MITSIEIIEFNKVSLLQGQAVLVIEQVAVDSERKGMFEDAIKLYNLAGVSFSFVTNLVV